LVGGLAAVAAGLIDGQRWALGVAMLWLATGTGWWLAPTAPQGTTRVAIVEPGTGAMESRQRINTQHRAERLQRLAGTVTNADWIALPENSWPFNPDRFEAPLPAVVGVTLRADGRTNSLMVVEGGSSTDRYDKHHLVPAAEQRFFVIGVDVYRPGLGPRSLTVAGVQAGPLICYEDMLPRAVRRTAAAGPQVLLAASNDAWLGAGRGSQLHLSASRVAAVETRRWVVRPTTCGRSAVIDDKGGVRWQTTWVDGDASPQPGLVSVQEVELRRPTLCGAMFGPWCGLLAALLLLWRGWRAGPQDGAATD